MVVFSSEFRSLVPGLSGTIWGWAPKPVVFGLPKSQEWVLSRAVSLINFCRPFPTMGCLRNAVGGWCVLAIGRRLYLSPRAMPPWCVVFLPGLMNQRTVFEGGPLYAG